MEKPPGLPQMRLRSGAPALETATNYLGAEKRDHESCEIHRLRASLSLTLRTALGPTDGSACTPALDTDNQFGIIRHMSRRCCNPLSGRWSRRSPAILMWRSFRAGQIRTNPDKNLPPSSACSTIGSTSVRTLFDCPDGATNVRGPLAGRLVVLATITPRPAAALHLTLRLKNSF